MNKATLTMPRPLAMRLLHEAQVAVDAVEGVVAAREHDPECYFAGPLAEGLLRAAADGRRPWAVFRYWPDSIDVPVAADFDDLPGLLRLTVSLATKGVLQLHLWRCAGGRVEECPLQIED